jgi:hypothetical protein
MMNPENNPNSNPMEPTPVKPKRKILQTIIINVVIGIVILWIAGAVATELTDGKSFLDDPSYTTVGAPYQKLWYDLLHPLNWLKKPVIPLVFNNGLESQYIKAGVNAAPATKEDMNSAGSIISSPTQQGYFRAELIFPALLQTGDQVKIAWKPFTIYKNTPEAATLKSRYDFTIERKGTLVTSGILDKDVKTIEVFKNPLYVVDNVPYFYGITIRVTRNDGSKYEVFCYEPEDVRRLKPLSILDDAPQLEEETVQVGNHTETKVINIDQPGKTINADTPLMETVAKNTVIEYGIGDQGYTTKSRVLVFDKVNFLTSKNNQLEYLPQPTKK